MDKPRNGLPKRHLYQCPGGREWLQKPLATGSHSGQLGVSCYFIMSYIDRTRSQIIDLKLQNFAWKLQISDSELQDSDLEIQDLNSELQISDWELQIVDSQLQIVDSEPRILDSEL